MFRLQYQNRGGVESLVSNFTVNVSGLAPTSAANYQAAFRYFELRKNSPGGSYAVTEQATFAPGAGNGATGDNRWMGSAANDNFANSRRVRGNIIGEGNFLLTFMVKSL